MHALCGSECLPNYDTFMKGSLLKSSACFLPRLRSKSLRFAKGVRREKIWKFFFSKHKVGFKKKRQVVVI